MKEFKVGNYTFRQKRMNAIEMLALRSQIDFENFKTTLKMYETMLTFIEVECEGQWLPVREELPNGKVNYFPAGIEDDITLIEEIIRVFMKEVLAPVFTNSNASK